jgi:hypothetical protein
MTEQMHTFNFSIIDMNQTRQAIKLSILLMRFVKINPNTFSELAS